MAENPESIKFDYYLGLVIKKRWFLIIPFCIAMVVGMYLAVALPKLYEASTLILIMPQRVPEDYVQSIVSSDIDSRISTMSQQILSRSNLERIIGKFGLFSEPKYSGMFLGDMVENLRKRIVIEVNQSRRRQADAFSITFQGPHPETVVDVTNGLANSFIEENLRNRETQAVGTSDFLADELTTKRKRLVEVEQKLQEYHRQHMGELPDQLESNLRTLDRLQTQLSARERSLRDEKYRLANLENQIEAHRRNPTENREIVSEEGNQMSLAMLKAQLAALTSNYTDRHPDVIKLKAKIADMEKSNAEISPDSQPGESGDPTARMVSSVLNDLIQQRGDIKREIQVISADIARLNRDIRIYQERIEKTPKREQELLTLNRDYSNIQDSYNSLLNRKLESEIAVNMEKKQKGEQFRIVDNASLPRNPVSPDIKKLFALSVAAGLGIGAGLIFLLDFFDNSLKQTKDYETELGLTVLATIPEFLGPSEKRFIRINQALTLLSLIVAAALAAGFGAMLINGVEPTVELMREFAKI
jgi:polysaccharide chain length determinant protein (PEP-CTERM system associated)